MAEQLDNKLHARLICGDGRVLEDRGCRASVNAGLVFKRDSLVGERDGARINLVCSNAGS